MFYRFYGGVHPSAFKSFASDKPIKNAAIPKKVILPLSQHTGVPAEPVVKVGDLVKAGDLVGKPSGYISSAVHASVSGKVIKIAYFATHNNPRVLSVVIESDLSVPDRDYSMLYQDISSLSVEVMLNMVKDSGVVGLGGAAFPTHVKLSPPKGKEIDTVILNGAECEPFLTCDHRLMLERTEEILKGLECVIKIVGAKRVFIAIEDNKLSAIAAFHNALNVRSGLCGIAPKIVSLPTKYPQGAEKQIIKALIRREVPALGLPMDVGCLVHNAGTLFAIYEAIFLNKPLTERVITITGSCVRDPVNINVKVGTLLSDIIHLCGGFKEDPKKVIMGGPMMGVSQYSMDVPISKGVSGVVFLTGSEVGDFRESVCIRCGRCLEACPMKLAPTSMMYRVKKEDWLGVKGQGIMNCYECGACAFTCPAKIPLVDYMKFGKAKLQAMKV